MQMFYKNIRICSSVSLNDSFMSNSNIVDYSCLLQASFIIKLQLVSSDLWNRELILDWNSIQ